VLSACGDPASLLVLDASPLEDGRNTRKIHTVVHHGRMVERQAPVADD
jgi:imidazolonepropionase-like amidohydrolase